MERMDSLTQRLPFLRHNVNDHRAAGVIYASKHARSAASRASSCYPAIAGCAIGFRDTVEPFVVTSQRYHSHDIRNKVQ